MCAIYLPEKCLRDRKDCKPISQIESDDTISFCCCGISEEQTRTVKEDRFRVCWVSKFVDEISDYDERDMKDTISVLVQALSVDENMKNR